LSSLALFQGFWILTLISTLGSWGYPPVLDFWVSSKYGEYPFLISKFPLLDSPALFFCRQVAKLRHKKKNAGPKTNQSSSSKFNYPKTCLGKGLEKA
jgi:hypothetical protein